MEKKQDILFFIFMSSFWALNYTLVKLALSYENAFTLLLYRVIFSIIGIILIFNRKINLKMSLISHLKMIILSLFNVFIFMELWFIGESTVSSSLSSIMIYTYPVISTFLSLVLLHEKYTKETVAGIIFGFLGVIVIFSDSIGAKSYYGVVLELLAAISWSIGTIFYKHFIRTEDRVSTNFYQFAYGLIPIFLVSLVLGNPSQIVHPPISFILLAIIIGIPGTSVAYYLFLRLNRDYNVSTISSFLFLVPALSVVFAFFILDETLSLLQITGFLLVSVGIIFSSRGNRKTRTSL
ncbi:DMT family transporter [Cuniculiplasma sp. SKW3]|uniref:DMT family transporter n=1 Tax=unclassified Cuniculiplasma TaxID=2619706 RepID=UPI003FD1FE5B